MDPKQVAVWREDITIPTYECGNPEKMPMFLENRVYQGSSGIVYPYPVIEKIADTKTDHLWHAVFLENEFIKVMLLPELGGRVQMAYDKVRQRHFVYYNSVIKPALVGLAGPWISGGIEFNWPQHHRPSTFLPVDCHIEQHEDGSATVWMNEQERLTGQKGMAGFTLYPGKAYLEVEGRVSNPTSLPQTFLWWANPAVHVNDAYRSVFPPDIHAVFDHGKRAVSTFPIATGTYYKVDYSAGVDIANYRNIPVPTSYMAADSQFDFEGGYEMDTKGGMLHVASHHLSPGKKQWTWGNGDFGRAWDRNLTDENGPYIELMAGVYTENQPGFSWLMPLEQKHFRQYFMPYHDLPDVKNASKDMVMDVEPVDDHHVRVLIFATSNRTVALEWEDQRELLSVSPEAIAETTIEVTDATSPKLVISICDTTERPLNGRVLLTYSPSPDKIHRIPEPAHAALSPQETKTVEQLFLTGQHLEQYRHASWNPVDYYEEGLRRDSDDIRCNNAMGRWHIRHGNFSDAIPFLQRAVKCQQRFNPNPADGEPLYNLALAHYYLHDYESAYNLFWKATWNVAWAAPAYLHCALISIREHRYLDALDECDRCLRFAGHAHQAYAVMACVLRLLDRDNAAVIDKALSIDPFNYGCWYERYLLTGEDSVLDQMKQLMHGNDYNYDELALLYTQMGRYNEACAVWKLAKTENALSKVTYFLWADAYHHLPDDSSSLDGSLPTAHGDLCPFFPNRLEDISVLCQWADAGNARAAYLLGCLYYDKRRYDEAAHYWQLSAQKDGTNPSVWRCLALYYYNRQHQSDQAVEAMERAYHLDETDSRMLMELDQLYRVTHRHPLERLKLLQSHLNVVSQRDDLYLSLITLLSQTGQYSEAIERMDEHVFHPWEGGEGKVSLQYQTCRVELAKQYLSKGQPAKAIPLLEQCLIYPPHLGEGKLASAQDNDFNYLLGVCHAQMGNLQHAHTCWTMAAQGTTEPAAAMYYNDARPEKIFYKGLALLQLAKLGTTDTERKQFDEQAKSVFNRLVNFGENHLFDEMKMDYFAVSLPDMLIWDGDLQVANTLHCLFMASLGHWGLGRSQRTLELLDQARSLDPYNQSFQTFLTLINMK